MTPDLLKDLNIAASEGVLALGGLVLLMVGAFVGEKSARLVSILSVALLVAASAVAATGPLGVASTAPTSPIPWPSTARWPSISPRLWPWCWAADGCSASESRGSNTPS